MKIEFAPQIVEKYSDIKLHEKSFSLSRVVFLRMDGRRDMEKLIVAGFNICGSEHHVL